MSQGLITADTLQKTLTLFGESQPPQKEIDAAGHYTYIPLKMNSVPLQRTIETATYAHIYIFTYMYVCMYICI